MIGAFLTNTEKDVCFAQFSDPRSIHQVNVYSQGYIVFGYCDGSDEMMTEELDPLLIERLEKKKSILIARLGSDGECVSEKEVILQYFQ